MSRRLEKLSHLFQHDLADLIRNELRDPRLGEIVSVTRVTMSPDLENASVYVSILGEAEEKAATMRALSSASHFLRRRLLERVRIRKVPELHFVLDESIEEAAHVLDLMRQVSADDR